jgi:hypothetical protein
MLVDVRKRDMIEGAVIQVGNCGGRCVLVIIFEARHAAVSYSCLEADLDILEDGVAVVVHAAVQIPSFVGRVSTSYPGYVHAFTGKGRATSCPELQMCEIALVMQEFEINTTQVVEVQSLGWFSPP